jgi:hypothetical protein
VSFEAITLCVASQRVLIVITLWTQSGNFWIHPRIQKNDTYVLLNNVQSAEFFNDSV